MRLIVVAVLLTACGAAATDPTASPSATPGSLEGRTFVSAFVTRGGAPFQLEPNTNLRITFQNGRVTASAGCNTISGAVAIQGNLLVVSELATTDMACAPPPLMAQEQWFAGVVGSRPTLALDGDNLTITAPNTVIAMVDRAVAEPDAKLVGPLWTVDTIIAGESASSVPQDVTATLQFDANGGLTLNTGCNSGGGRYAADATTIAFTDLVTTKRACAGSGNVLETAVMEVLRANSVPFSIDAQTLTLTAGAAGLQLTAR
jgi:heat shock protein HslJ